MKSPRDRREQHVGRTRCLIDIHKKMEPFRGHPPGHVVDQGGLRHRRQRLVRAHNDKIRAEPDRRFRKIRMNAEMRSVRPVHDQARTPPVGKTGPARDIPDAPFVPGTRDNDRIDLLLRTLPVSGFFLRRSADSLPDIRYMKLTKVSRMIDGHMARPLDQDPSALRYRCRHCCQHTAGRPVHRKNRLPGTVKGSRGLHFLREDLLRVVQIVKSVDLRDIDCPGLRRPSRREAALMTGHMKSVRIGFRVRL